MRYTDEVSVASAPRRDRRRERISLACPSFTRAITLTPNHLFFLFTCVGDVQGEIMELCKWTIDLGALPSFQQNASTPNSNGFYTGASLSLLLLTGGAGVLGQEEVQAEDSKALEATRLAAAQARVAGWHSRPRPPSHACNIPLCRLIRACLELFSSWRGARQVCL